MDYKPLEERIQALERLVHFLLNQLAQVETSRRATTQALVDLLINKGLFSEKEFENASTRLKSRVREEVIRLLGHEALDTSGRKGTPEEHR